MSDIDPLEMAKTELAAGLIMDPLDLLQDVGPLAQIWFAHECVYGVMKSFVGMLTDDAGSDITDDDGPAKALQALSIACGNLDAACAHLNILPDDVLNAG